MSGSEDTRIIRELDDGTRVQQVGGLRSPYHIVSPYSEDRVIERESWDSRRKALTLAQLESQTEGLEIVDEGTVPVDVAVLGQAAIAAYLYAVHDIDWRRWTEPSLEDIMGVKRSTARQYVAKFRRGER